MTLPAVMSDMRTTIIRLLSSMASTKEIQQYLKRFSQLDAARFAVVKVGGAVLRDELDALVSSLAYAAVATLLFGAALGSAAVAPPGWGRVEPLFAMALLLFAVGLALCVIRERSLSLLPGIAFQLVGLLFACAGGWVMA